MPIHIDYNRIKLIFLGMISVILFLVGLSVYSFVGYNKENKYVDYKEKEKHLMELQDMQNSAVNNIGKIDENTYYSKISTLIHNFKVENKITSLSQVELNNENIRKIKYLNEQIAYIFKNEVLDKLNRPENVNEFFTTDKIEAALMENIKYGILASVTLAQSADESAYGNSTLAKKANNYFGIKYKKQDTGKYNYYSINTKEELTKKQYLYVKKTDRFVSLDKKVGNIYYVTVCAKFRKYDSWWHSFRDHSNFLARNDRYAKLFQRGGGNYKKWTETFKPANEGGVPYATSRSKSKRLEGIIIINKLYMLDF